MPRAESNGLRQAALLVHSLPRNARASVLARVTGPHVHDLNDSLSELQALGIPSGRVWLDSIDDPSAASHALPTDDDWTQLNDLLPETALDALQGQCVESVALVLRTRDWRWKEFVLANWPADQRHRLTALTQETAAPADAVVSIMVKAMAQRAHKLTPPVHVTASAEASGHSWFKQLAVSLGLVSSKDSP